MIGMGSENYEIIDKLESIAKSLESLAESQKRIADTSGVDGKEKGNCRLRRVKTSGIRKSVQCKEWKTTES